MQSQNPITIIVRRVVVMAASVWLSVPIVHGGSVKSSVNEASERQKREHAAQEGQELLLRGDQAYYAGKYEQAIEAYGLARESFPDAPNTLELRGAATERYAQASIERAREMAKQGNVDGAKAVLNKVLAATMAPKHEGAMAMMAQLDDPIRTNPAQTPEHTANIDEVRRLLYLAIGAFELGKFDESNRHYESILRIDPTNTAARRGMEQVAMAKAAYGGAAKDQARAELLNQVEGAWELPIPADVDPSAAGMRLETKRADGEVLLEAKLNRIVIPKIHFEQVNLEEALQYLRTKSVELDTVETDPERKGINFTMNLGAADGEVSKNILAQRFDLSLNGVPLAKVLKYLGDLSHTGFQADEFAVTFRPVGVVSGELENRVYHVTPDFITGICTKAAGEGEETDPFATNTGSKGLLTQRKSVVEALKGLGVQFPEGATASYSASSNTLQVLNTASNQDMVYQMIQESANKLPMQVVIHVTMIRTQTTVLEELGFDTLITPVPMNSDGSLMLGGGTVGNGTPRTAGDFSSPMPGLPALDSAVVSSGSLTNGLRSGNYAIHDKRINSVLNNFDRTTKEAEIAPGIMSVTGLFSDGQVQTIMRGLSQKKNVDLMSRPTVVTRSGQQASIESVREMLYPTEYDPPQIPSSVGQGGNSAVVPATPKAFQKKDIGVILDVLPVADVEKGMIDLTLKPVFADFDGFVNYGSAINTVVQDALGNSVTRELTKNAILMPVFSSQRLSSQLTVYDGATVAIGGLLSDEVQTVEDKVPVLGDIPMVGRLFQTKATRPVKTAIVFLVKVELKDPTGKPLR